MKIAIFFSLLLSSQAFAGSIPVHLLYFRTGVESESKAEEAGRREVESGNPCARAFDTDLKQLSSDPAMVGAGEELAKSWLSATAPHPNLRLHLSRGSVLLRFELRNESGEVVFARERRLSERMGTWKKRISRDSCRISAAERKGLAEQVAEPTLLFQCKSRKIELLDPASRLGHYLHEYVPDRWVEKYKEMRANKGESELIPLQADEAPYRTGNETYRSCRKGLELLEAHSRSTVLLLRDLTLQNSELSFPSQLVSDLERLLDTPPASK